MVAYLLILSCSQRKRADRDALPALDRYDGVNYRVLRKFQREHARLPTGLDILILSAQHRLIEATASIAWYDLRMTEPRAMDLRSNVSSSLALRLSQRCYDSVFVALGRVYRLTLDGAVLASLSGMGERAIWARGGIGEQARQLKTWLASVEGVR